MTGKRTIRGASVASRRLFAVLHATRPPTSAARHLLTSEYEREEIMLWILAMLLFALWAVGLVTSYTVGGFIHLLLVFALIAVLVRVIQGRRIT